MLVLLAAVVTGAWAQTETLLTTITPTGKDTYSETTTGVVTVTHDNDDFYDEYGWVWWDNPGSVTVVANEGYTISKCVFHQYDRTVATIFTSPFKINFIYYEGGDYYEYYYCQGTNPDEHFDGVSSIEVYGYAPTVAVTSVSLSQTEASLTVGGETLTLTPTVLPDNATDKTVTWTTSDASVATVADGVVTAVAVGTATITVTTTDGAKTATCTVTVAEPTYTVTVKEGTEDANKWEIAPAEATTAGVAAGTTVTATYSGTKKVKSVKAVKKAAAELGHALSASAVGELVGSDGKAYAVADKDNLPQGVTAVAMVAYRSETVGSSLAIQLNDNLEEKNWSAAKTYAEGLAAVSGGTWHLPSMTDWQYMFVGCAVSGDATEPDEDDEMGPITGFQEKIGATGITWQSGDYWSSTGSGSGAGYVDVYLGGNYTNAEFHKSGSGSHWVLGCLAF